MKKEELMKVYYLDKEIAEWKEEIKRIRESALPRSPRLGMSLKMNGNYEDKVAKAATLIADTERKIDDCQTRLIFKLRCLDNMSWNQVADKVGGMNSEYSVKKRFYRYLEKCS